MQRLFLIFRFRELLFNLTRRNLKVRYKGSFFGFLWSFINPLLLMLIYSVVFSKIVRVDTGRTPYFIFFFTGLVPWIFVSSTVAVSINCFLENGGIIKKIFIPLEIIPLSVVLSNLINLLFSMCVLLLFFIFFHIGFTKYFLLFPVVLLLQTVLVTGVSLVFSTLNVFFRDIANMTDALILSWFFISPVFYPAETYVPAKYNFFYYLNPMAGIVEMNRAIFIHSRFISIDLLLETVLSTGLILMLGIVIFNRFYKRIPEEI